MLTSPICIVLDYIIPLLERSSSLRLLNHLSLVIHNYLWLTPSVRLVDRYALIERIQPVATNCWAIPLVFPAENTRWWSENVQLGAPEHFGRSFFFFLAEMLWLRLVTNKDNLLK